LMGYVNQYSDEGNKVKEAEYQAKLEARRKPSIKGDSPQQDCHGLL